MSVRLTRALRPMRSCPSPLRSLASQQANFSTQSARSAVYKPTQAAKAPTSASTATKASSYSRPAAAAVAASSPKPASTPTSQPAPAAPGPATAASPFATTSSFDDGDAIGGPDGVGETINWSASFHGLGRTPFSPEIAAILMAPLEESDIEIKPDGIIYLPEIKYRRILNRSFGPGGWGLAPRSDLVVGDKIVTREYALVAHGRYIAQARGENNYFSAEGIPTAGEGCKSNAMMRCCKDLGIGSELWDPRFIPKWKKKYAEEVWVEHATTKKRRQIWIRKGDDVSYPLKRV